MHHQLEAVSAKVFDYRDQSCRVWYPEGGMAVNPLLTLYMAAASLFLARDQG